MIKALEVLTNTYNTDYKNPTSLWPTQEQHDLNRTQLAPYLLPQNTLPESTRLEFDPKTRLYVVIGPNGIGKSTFLRSIARSIANAQYFESHNRTKRFDGKIGVARAYHEELVENTGGLLFRSGNLFDRAGDTITDRSPGYATTAHDISKSYFADALRFYLTRNEIFNSEGFAPYARISDKDIERRIGALFGTRKVIDGLRERYEIGWYKNHECIDTLMDATLKESGIKRHDLYRRLAYLVELNAYIGQLPIPANIFGEYKLELGVPVQEIKLGIFDPNLRTRDDQVSAGQYARNKLGALLKVEGKHLMLIDEPTANMDLQNSRWFNDQFLCQVVKMKNTMVLVAANDPSVVQKTGQLKGKSVNMYEKLAVVSTMVF